MNTQANRPGMCTEHRSALKAALAERGLAPLCATSYAEAMAADFDPLVVALLSLAMNATKHLGVQPDGCPICAVVTDCGCESSPVCPEDPPCDGGHPRPKGSCGFHNWVQAAAQDVLHEAVKRGLLTEPLSH